MSYKAKAIYLKEKKALTKLLSMFEEQLNRLKVEEMALMSYIKMESMQESNAPVAQEVVKTSPVAIFKDASELNQETLDLQVRETDGARRLAEFDDEVEGMKFQEEVEEEESDDDIDEGSMLKSYME